MFIENTECVPNDNKYHRVQILGDSIYVDGKYKSPSIKECYGEFTIKNRVLSVEEIAKLYEESFV